MADLRPLGSEKLQGMNKIDRILQLSYYMDAPIVESDNNKTLNYSVVLSDGKTYGIVKEKLGYIIKSGLNESTLDYTDNMRNRKYYRSYSEAIKRLNLMTKEINTLNGYNYNISLIGEQEEDQKKKFVLKTKTATPTPDAPTPPAGEVPAPPAVEVPAPPAGEVPAPPAGEVPAPPSGEDPSLGGDVPPPPSDFGAEEPGMEDTGMEDTGMEDTGMEDTGMEDTGMGEEGEEEVGPTGLKTIQKLTGRLSQKIRSFDKEKGLDSQDIKYVVNSILSAIDLSKLDDDDRDEILNKLEDYDEYGAEGEGELDLEGEEMGMEEPGIEEPGIEEPGMEEPGMEEQPSPPPPVAESRVEKMLKSYFKIDKKEKPLLEEKRKKEFLNNKLKTILIKNEIQNLSESNSQRKVSLNLIENYKNVKFIGKTNQENLVFNVNGKQVKVTPRGRII
jgi:hypothetical protein